MSIAGLDKAPKELLVDLINERNFTIFDPEDLNVTNVQPMSEGEDPFYNTTVVVSGTGTTPYTGPDTLRYRRLVLDDVMSLYYRGFDLPAREEPYTMADVVGLVNTRFHTMLDWTDFEPTPIPTGVNEQLVLTAKHGAIAFTGDLVLTINPPAP